MREPKSSRDWFGQPRGLTVLFLTETWELFSYYGMRTLLVYYMTKGLAFPQSKASLIYGLYTGGVYLTPLFGGPLADRWLGRRRAILIGGAIMAAGHFMMAAPSLFFPALFTIAIGNGLFLPSLPAQIAPLYADGDPRAKSAVNIYYLGVNVGGFFAPLVCGALGETFGWHYGFAAAGVGMLIALATYTAGRRLLPPDPVRNAGAIAPTVSTTGSPPLLKRFLLLGGIVLVVVIFRAVYEQVGNTVALFTDTGIDRRLFGFPVPMTWFITLNPLLVLILTPLVVRRWTGQAQKGREPSTVRKMALGALGVGLAYAFLAFGAWRAGGHGAASAFWLIGYYIILTASELYILPVGLGLFGRIAPRGLAATAVAAWFSAAFLGNILAGVLGQLFTPLGAPAFFALAAGVVMLAAALLLLFDPAVRRAEAAA